MQLLDSLRRLRYFIGNTPLKKIELHGINAYAKLEYNNLSGSVKDRAAYYILSEAIRNNEVTSRTVVVESSSGNFAVALMNMCNAIGVKFIPVIDPNTNADVERLLRLHCEVVKVTEIDHTGGYLLNRIAKVKEICSNHPHSYWTDQYSNVNNYLCYYHTLGREICSAFDRIDYVFVGVSSGGTIAGVSRRVKDVFSKSKIVAVDIEGSVIFDQKPMKRYISGIGSSKVPDILKHAVIDDVVHVTHTDIVEGCNALFKDQSIFAGGSAGACYHAVKNYHYECADGRTPTVVFICPDRGNAYLNTVYNPSWVEKFVVPSYT